MAYIQSQFDNETERQFRESQMNRLYDNRKNKTFKEGNIVLLQNYKAKHTFGIAVVGCFSNGLELRERHLLDNELYSSTSSKYNKKYEICLSKVNLLPKPIPFNNLATLLGLDNTKENNICKGTNLSHYKLYYKSDDEKTILLKIQIWIESLL